MPRSQANTYGRYRSVYHGDDMTDPAPRRHLIRRSLLVLSAAAIMSYLLLVLLLRPSNDRDWSLDQQHLATAEFSGDSVRVRNVRNAYYRSTTDFDVHWEDRTFDLRQLESVWYVVEPFASWRGPAHTFLSFGFDNGEYISISVEIRKERGEAFSPLSGLLRQYELAYIVGDERDLIGLRANHRNDDVHLYPMRVTQAAARALFVSMLERANALAEQPEFYNTLTSTCTSNIVDHVSLITPEPIPFSYKTLLPAYSDDLAFDLGMIDTALPREQFRAAFRINDLALKHADSVNFSEAIRSHHRK
ncbi:DUF4105 domain-containing protein [Dokdonella sp.]|uniref:Lnb N-terminal periplasmic domain-containing protein n=1 Tax=Dokdonella sp. TaxID=2291710 RepID=UPI003C6AC561